MVETAMIALLVYGVLLILGGIAGFATKRSVPSLIMGCVMGVLAIVSFIWTGSAVHHGLALGLVVSLVVGITFVFRYMKTREMMPAGAVLILSIIMFVITLLGLLF